MAESPTRGYSVKSVEHARLDARSRLRFRCDVTALDLLCSPGSVSRLGAAVESLNTRDRRNFLRGYRLAVATPLSELLSFVVDRAELLGLEQDGRLSNWLHFRSPARGESALSAVSDPTSGVGRLCYVFNDLASELRRTEGGFTDTTAAIEKCRATAKEFDEVLAGTKVVSLDSWQELTDGESLMRMRLCLAERVLDYVEYDPGTVSQAHRLVWRDDEEFRPIDDFFVLRAETHLSHVSLFPFGKGVPYEWWSGTLLGFDLILQLSGITLPAHPQSASDSGGAQDWVNELTDRVKLSHPEGKWPSRVYGLTEFSGSVLGRMMGRVEANMDTVSSKHRLAALLGSDRVRLISDAGGTDALELKVMLSGAVATHGDSRIHVLVLTHSVSPDDREWVSIAFRLPMYGSFSNASKWFLFYKMYHKGMVLDTDVTRNTKAVEELFLRLRDKLEVEEIGGLDSEDFLPLCVLPALRAMSELSHRAVETNADLRSGNSELLAAFWLVGQGYSHVKVSLKRASLGDSDFDAIGVKDGRCLVIEVKRASLVDSELQNEIGTFAKKVGRLRDQMPALKQALGSESDINEVSGLFIFLGDLDGFKPADPSIPLWGYDDFVKALKAMGIPNRIVGLLDQCHIIHSMETGDFPADPFFVGLEDSEE